MTPPEPTDVNARQRPELIGLSDAGGDVREEAGAARGIRTPDPLITNEVLYQLSYCGDGWGCISPTPF